MLLLVSTSIDLKALNDSPRFESHSFFALNAMQHLDKLNSTHKTQSFLDILDNTIKYVKPSYLIVHLGLAFEHYPAEILNTVLDVKEFYPKIKIGFDRGLEYAIHRIQVLVTATPEKKKLLDRLINNQSFFDSDKEMIYLASCLL